MSLGANQWQIFKRITFKAAFPSIISGMKTSLALELTVVTKYSVKCLKADVEVKYFIKHTYTVYVVIEISSRICMI